MKEEALVPHAVDSPVYCHVVKQQLEGGTYTAWRVPYTDAWRYESVSGRPPYYFAVLSEAEYAEFCRQRDAELGLEQ